MKYLKSECVKKARDRSQSGDRKGWGKGGKGKDGAQGWGNPGNGDGKKGNICYEYENHGYCSKRPDCRWCREGVQ